MANIVAPSGCFAPCSNAEIACRLRPTVAASSVCVSGTDLRAFASRCGTRRRLVASLSFLTKERMLLDIVVSAPFLNFLLDRNDCLFVGGFYWRLSALNCVRHQQQIWRAV